MSRVCVTTRMAMIIAIASIGSSLYAQTPPDAGALRQQFEEPFRPALPQDAIPLSVTPPSSMPLSPSVQLHVNAFRFAGNTLLSDARLQEVVQAWQGRVLRFEDLQQVAQAVAAVYRQAGWIVRVYLPEQDVTEGIVTLQVVEAVFSGAHIQGEPSGRVRPARVLAYVASQQPLGQPLNAAALDRALLLADDLPGINVTGALQPGGRDGETALALSVRDEPWLTGNIGIDDNSSRSTGTTRATFTASVNSPLGLGDLLRTDLMHTEGSDYARLAYSVPVGGNSWRVGVNVSWFGYHLVSPEFAALKGRGDSRSVGMDASYALLRSRMQNLYLSFAYNYNHFYNEANSVAQSDYVVNAASVTLAGNAYDSVFGGGANQAMLSWHYGRVDQGTLDPGENHTLAGSFNKLRYSVSRRQVITPNVALYGSLNGQYANRQLDSSERFYLGGAHGVRAYPVNEAGGSRGNLAKLELRWRALPFATFSGFYDWGRVSQVSSGPSSQTLKGMGVGVLMAGPWGSQLEASVAWRHGKNPYPTINGRDQDGSYRSPRAWLQASLPF